MTTTMTRTTTLLLLLLLLRTSEWGEGARNQTEAHPQGSNRGSWSQRIRTASLVTGSEEMAGVRLIGSIGFDSIRSDRCGCSHVDDTQLGSKRVCSCADFVQRQRYVAVCCV